MKLAIITCQMLPQGAIDDANFLLELAQQGFDVDVVAWDDEVDWSNYDACLLRSVWDYHDRIDAFNQWLDETAKLTEIINPPEVISWNQNKLYLKELDAFGVTIAPTTWINREQKFDLQQWAQNQDQQTFFLKPVIGADSSGTLRFANDPEGILLAQKHLEKWLPEFDMMLQPYLSQVETFGETSAIYFAGSLSHAVRKIPVSGDYRVQDNFGATDVPYTLSGIEMALSKACLDFLQQKFSDVLYARFDFLHDEHGTAYLNEAELIEPSLFFSQGEQAAKTFAASLFDHFHPADEDSDQSSD